MKIYQCKSEDVPSLVPILEELGLSYEETLRRWSQNERFIVTVTGLEVRDTAGDVADRTVSQLHRCRPGTTTPKLLRDIADEHRYRLRHGGRHAPQPEDHHTGRPDHAAHPAGHEACGRGVIALSSITFQVR